MAGSNWKEVDYVAGHRKQKALQKDFIFPDFISALAFVNKVGEAAEKMNHHPDIVLSWGSVRVWLTTHSEHTITEHDHKLAKITDQIYAKQNPS